MEFTRKAAVLIRGCLFSRASFWYTIPLGQLSQDDSGAAFVTANNHISFRIRKQHISPSWNAVFWLLWTENWMSFSTMLSVPCRKGNCFCYLVQPRGVRASVVYTCRSNKLIYVVTYSQWPPFFSRSFAEFPCLPSSFSIFLYNFFPMNAEEMKWSAAQSFKWALII